MEEAGAKENLYLPSCYSAHYPRIIGIVFAKSDIPRPGWRTGVITNTKPQAGPPIGPDRGPAMTRNLSLSLSRPLPVEAIEGGGGGAGIASSL